MSRTGRLLLIALLGVVAVIVVRSTTSAPTAAVATGPAFAHPTAASRARGFTFVGVTPVDQQIIQSVVAGADPGARRLIEAVEGLVTVTVGSAGAEAAGYTQPTSTGYDVQFDLDGTAAAGPRAERRLILHELGHVVRFALVPDALLKQLDAGIPAGYGCEDGVMGACAPTEERFAESFAKWAANDIGVNVNIGYTIPPPTLGLAAWAAPLVALPTG